MNTRENVRRTFDQKVEHVIQDIVDSNFDLYKRITTTAQSGEAIKNQGASRDLTLKVFSSRRASRGPDPPLAFEYLGVPRVPRSTSGTWDTSGLGE